MRTFCCRPTVPEIDIEVTIVEAHTSTADDVEVECNDGEWLIRRGDFTMTWMPSAGRATSVVHRRSARRSGLGPKTKNAFGPALD